MSATLAAVASFSSLIKACRAAARGKRLTRVAARFLLDLEPNVLRLEEALLAETWRPGPFTTFVVADPKPRRISATPFPDRVVHHAIAAVLEPRIEATASPSTCACRKGFGTTAALALARALVSTHPYFCKLDVRRYFETMVHSVLVADLEGLIADPGLQRLVRRIVEAGAPGSPPGVGVPIGNLTSQHFANLYLAHFDHGLHAAFPGVGYVRYMDDLLMLGRREEMRAVESWATTALSERGLAVKEEVTRRGPVSAGVPFLGFRLWPAAIRLDGHRKRRLARRLRDVEDERVLTGDDERAARRASSLLGWSALADAEALTRHMTAPMNTATFSSAWEHPRRQPRHPRR